MFSALINPQTDRQTDTYEVICFGRLSIIYQSLCVLVPGAPRGSDPEEARSGLDLCQLCRPEATTAHAPLNRRESDSGVMAPASPPVRHPSWLKIQSE